MPWWKYSCENRVLLKAVIMRKAMNIQKNPVTQALLRVLACIVICHIAAAVSAFPAWSQDQKEVKTGETEQVKKQPPAINVYLQGLYEVNTNNPSSGLNDFRPFDYRSIFIDPDLLEIRVNQDPDRGRLGYRVKVTAGETHDCCTQEAWEPTMIAMISWNSFWHINFP